MDKHAQTTSSAEVASAPTAVSAATAARASARSAIPPLNVNDLHDHGNFLHDHDTGTELHKHRSGRLHDHETDDLLRIRSDGTLRNLGSRHSFHHDHHHGHHDDHHSSFFLGIGLGSFYGPFWPGFYDPFWYDPFWHYPAYYPVSGFGFSYRSQHFGIGYFAGGYDPWPYYVYDPVCVYPAPVYVDEYVVDPGYAARVDVAGPSLYSTNPSAPPAPASSLIEGKGEFAADGEAAFKARDYKAAVRSWRHALVDDPKNPVLVMMLAQALFAVGEYDEAAGATQAAMRVLPEDKWGVVVSNYTELYSDTQDYVDQLKSLEKAVKENEKEPGVRFLVGFHYAYLGYPAEAVRELDKLVELAPKDEMGRRLRDKMAEKLKGKEESGPKPVEPSSPDGK